MNLWLPEIHGVDALDMEVGYLRLYFTADQPEAKLASIWLARYVVDETVGKLPIDIELAVAGVLGDADAIRTSQLLH